jgi:hypothetical protein
MVRDELGRIVKSASVVTNEAASDAASVEEGADVLSGYREQASALETAVASVTTLQQETISTTQAREKALSQREALLADWAATENEASVEELAKLGARSEVFQAKLNSQAARLAQAESVLRQGNGHLRSRFAAWAHR